MSLNDILVCSIIKYFENSVTVFLWSSLCCGVGAGGGGGRGRGLVVGGGGACVLRSNCYPVILRDKISLSYNPFAKLTYYK